MSTRQMKLFSLVAVLVLSLGIMVGKTPAWPNKKQSCSNCHDLNSGVTTSTSVDTLVVVAGSTSDMFTVTVTGSGYHQELTASDLYLPEGWSANQDYTNSSGLWYWTDEVDDPDHTETFSADITVPGGAAAGNYVVVAWGAGCSTEGRASDLDTIVVSVTATGVEEENQPSNRAAQFRLYQNYPNPFNPETEISYTLLVDCWVRLTIYNLRGQRVRALVDEYQTKGDKFAQWDGKDEGGCQMASGVYFYRLQAGEYNETRKLALIK